MPVHIESALARLSRGRAAGGKQRVASWKRLAFAGAMAGVYALLAVKLVGRLAEMPVKRSEYPVAAMQFIADNNLRGKAVVAFNWAQYAIDAVGPSRPGAHDGLLVACDGRLRTCYPQELIDYHFDFTLGPGDASQRYRDPSSPSFDAARTLRHGNPDLVLLDRRQPHSVRTIEAHASEWRLLYQDRLAQLWGRAAVYDNPSSEFYLPPSRRVIGDARQHGVVAWPALPRKAATTAAVKGRFEKQLVQSP
jgi:hypothetical protein